MSSYVLLAMQTGLVAWIGLATGTMRPAPSMAMLAHLFICSWMIAHVFYGLRCMYAYTSMRALDRQAS